VRRTETDARSEETVDIRAIFRRMWTGRTNPKKPPNRRLPTTMRPILVQLARAQEQELSCDEVYALLDVFADKVSRGEDAAALMPLLQHHIEMCPDCQEEFTALLRSMKANMA